MPPAANVAIILVLQLGQCAMVLQLIFNMCCCKGPIKTAIWQKAVQHRPGTGCGDWHAYEDTAYKPALATSKRYLEKDNATPGKQISPEHVAKTVFKVNRLGHQSSALKNYATPACTGLRLWNSLHMYAHIYAVHLSEDENQYAAPLYIRVVMTCPYHALCCRDPCKKAHAGAAHAQISFTNASGSAIGSCKLLCPLPAELKIVLTLACRAVMIILQQCMHMDAKHNEQTIVLCRRQ